MMEGGRTQSRATADVLSDEYLRYEGVDRPFRLEALREIVLFHLARAERHGVPVGFDAQAVRDAFADDDLVRRATVSCSVVGWSPTAVANAGPVSGSDDVDQWLMGAEDIEQFEAAVQAWPNLPGHSPAEPGRGRPAGAQPPQPAEEPADEPATEPNPPTAEDPPLGAGETPGGRGEQPASVSEGVTAGSTLVPTHQQDSEDDQPAQADAHTPDVEEKHVVTLTPEPSPAGASALGSRAAGHECIRLGSIVGSGKPASWCPPLLSNGHLILIGGSGAGKTTALRHITAQLRALGLPVLVLDFHGDINPVGGAEHLYRFEYAGNSAFVNPFHLDAKYRLIPLRLRDQFIEAWKRRYYSMGIQQYNYLVDLIDAAFASKGITSDPATWIKHVDFGDVIDAFERSEAPDSVKDKIRAYMRSFSEWRIFHGGESIAVEQFLEGSARLDLSQLDENARSILADVVLRRLFLLCTAIGPLQDQSGWAKFRAYVVIDEAQILMGSPGDAKASLSRYGPRGGDATRPRAGRVARGTW